MKTSYHSIFPVSVEVDSETKTAEIRSSAREKFLFDPAKAGEAANAAFKYWFRSVFCTGGSGVPLVLAVRGGTVVSFMNVEPPPPEPREKAAE